ncbi:sugar ABC transporter ATP-binding protein [candidate division KSB1 bacterium]|nr:sugar ABC transporter ATP-binding protein [candidate division KSB1 bacterium]
MDRRECLLSATKLETLALRKEYPGTVALDSVSVCFEGGKIHALLGKNGAGKSTLVKLLAGAIQPTSGCIHVDGRDVRMRSPNEAFANGIATVYQELSLVPQLTVAENIFLGRTPKRRGSRGLMIDWPQTFADAQKLLAEIQVDLDVRRTVAELGVAQQQLVEIAKAMSFRPSALLLDEPTSALAQHETKNLFALIRRLAANGVAIIYITHRLQELEAIADCITVLRDGKLIGSIDMADANAEGIFTMIFGRVEQKERPASLKAGDEAILQVNNLRRKNALTDISFTLHTGEILGIAGMLGSGRTELLKALFGAEPFDGGEIRVGDTLVRSANPMRMKQLGIAFTPENRKAEGLVQILSTRVNMCLAGLNRIAPRGWLNRRREKKIIDQLAGDLDIRVSNIDFPVSSLSGGNQQKVVIANWLTTEPRIILFDEPTRGIDVQAKQQIFQIMWDLACRGISSIFVSSELEELLEVCHRILIMKSGRIVGQVRPEEISADELFVRCLEK